MGDGHEFGVALATARHASGLSLADLAGVTYASRGWINNVETGRRWPTRAWVEHADRALRADGHLLAAWEHGEQARVAAAQTQSLLQQSEGESRLQLVQPDSVDLDRLNESVAALAVAYLASPPGPMLEQAMALRRELVRRLHAGTVKTSEVSDLYVALGRASGVLAYAALDLGDATVAGVHGETTWRMADLAGDNELRAWARGTQSLTARFAKRYDVARTYVDDGMRYAGSGTSEVRLVCGAAQCAATLGDATNAIAFLRAARQARDRATADTVEGLFGFSPAKQDYYSASALMWLPDRPALEIAARDAVTAIETWRGEPPEQRSLDDETLAHVYLATARLKLGEVEGAMAAVRPVIDLPEDRQISWIRSRVSELSGVLDGPRFRNSVAACEARDELLEL